ncbi:hypothetical protein [Actinocatenispora rupis]|nr:hypothetical protein [Actinocatenispora rupis]
MTGVPDAGKSAVLAVLEVVNGRAGGEQSRPSWKRDVLPFNGIRVCGRGVTVDAGRKVTGRARRRRVPASTSVTRIQVAALPVV